MLGCENKEKKNKGRKKNTTKPKPDVLWNLDKSNKTVTGKYVISRMALLFDVRFHDTFPTRSIKYQSHLPLKLHSCHFSINLMSTLKRQVCVYIVNE